MANKFGLFQRKGSTKYSVKITVPTDLLEIVGGSPQKWRSTGTSDLAEAKRRALTIHNEFETRWASLRSGRTLDQVDTEHLVWNRYQMQLAKDEQTRQQHPSDDDLEDIWAHLVKQGGGDQNNLEAFRIVDGIREEAAGERKARHDKLVQLEKALANNNARPLHGDLDMALIDLGITPARTKSAYRNAALGLLRADIEALRRTIERDEGNFAGKPADPVVQQPQTTRQTAAKAKAKGQTIMELWTKFREQNEPGGRYKVDTWDVNENAVRTFAMYAGEHTLASEITHEMVGGFKDELFKWPVKALNIKAFAGKSFSEIIEANKTLGKPTIERRTINKYLNCISPFMSWLWTSQRLITEDVMNGHYLELDRKKPKVDPFTDNQLQALFSAPLFTLCGGAGKEHETGATKVRDWRYWLPLLGLFSGARLGELTQLRVADLDQSGGIWYFDITDDENEDDADPTAVKKRLKTSNSKRIVPVHSSLIKLGLLDYRAQQTGAQLFPKLKPDARGYWSGTASGFFGDFFTAIGIKTDKRTNFHSTRHAAADALRRAGYFDEQIAPILGHTKAGMTKKYGNVPEGPLRMRSEIIEAIDYDVPALKALIG